MNVATATLEAALAQAHAFVAGAREALWGRVAPDGRVEPARLDACQRAAHGLAWAATSVAALDAVLGWAVRAGGEAEAHVATLVFGEYLAQLAGGLPIGPGEYARPVDLGLDVEAQALAASPAVRAVVAAAAEPALRAMVAAHALQGGTLSEALDEQLDAIRAQFRRFTADRVTPFAQGWHLADDLIPDALVAEMAALGTFGVCIAPEHGGLGLGKLEMCVVTEELSRGWIGAGSLGTRSEIAGELIGANGTPEQQARWLPAIASGAVLPTAVFTEPGAGSDLASLATRAARQADGSWAVTGAKTWITHAARSDLMTLLARTGGPGHDGISMFLAEKPRGSREHPFPAAGMRGGEIPVLGYRGMREYELSFDGFAVAADGLLGGVEGQGFRQLMATFEGARIQTAARAVGLAWRTIELTVDYACQRRQFGKPLAAFPRVSDKIAMMVAETVAARELAYFAAREKDKGRRCDVEAGMAKLLAARVAWTNADACVQVHGGNGYALEHEASRLLCDARILSVFEGAAEIQAHVIARGLLSGRNG